MSANNPEHGSAHEVSLPPEAKLLQEVPTGRDDTLRLTLQLEAERAFHHVAE